MRIQVVSDLHVEFHADRGRSLLGSLDPAGVDVLVVAGDLGTVSTVGSALRTLCARYLHVVFVLGNHEYYGSSPAEVHAALHSFSASLSNLYWLHRSTVEIGGVVFAGATLWFRDTPDNPRYAYRMNDFSMIQGFVPWVYGENRSDEEFLRKAASRADVVVTHYLPAQGSVADEFRGSPLNRFFLCDVEPVVSTSGAALWVHGHTHAPCDYVCGDTRVLCNPLGYPGEASTPDLPPRVLVEVESRAGA